MPPTPAREGFEPVVLAFLVCDQIYTDHGSGKSSLLGLFSAMSVKELPTTVDEMCVYAVLTEGRGTQQLTVRIIDAAESRDPLIVAPVELEFRSPLDTEVLRLRLMDVTFPIAGEFCVQIHCGAALLAERRIVIEFEEPNHAD